MGCNMRLTLSNELNIKWGKQVYRFPMQKTH